MGLWTALGVLRFSAAAAGMAVVGLDVDWLWLRLVVVAAALVTLTVTSRKIRAEREYRELLTRTLAQALHQRPGAVPVAPPHRAR